MFHFHLVLNLEYSTDYNDKQSQCDFSQQFLQLGYELNQRLILTN